MLLMYVASFQFKLCVHLMCARLSSSPCSSEVDISSKSLELFGISEGQISSCTAKILSHVTMFKTPASHSATTKGPSFPCLSSRLVLCRVLLKLYDLCVTFSVPRSVNKSL